MQIDIGSKIKNFRENKNLSQQDLATMIHKTKSSVQKYESGSTSITIDLLYDISTALEIPIIQFFTDDADDILSLIKERFNLVDNNRGQIEYDFEILMEVLKVKYRKTTDK